MPDFLIELEKRLDAFAREGSSPQFRLFISSDPSNDIPIGLLQRSIKLTNEPPMGVKQNMKRAFGFFSKEYIEDKDPKIKTILFGLCFFHTVMLERRQFGPKGWNMRYPFSAGDLRDSSLVLNNYMETNAQTGKVPWDDLKYIFGEIMYGGHIIDDWDRILCAAYLDNLMRDDLLDEAELFPFVEGKPVSFKCPQPLSHEKYVEYIDTECPPETPLAFGMHPNAEIDFRTNQCIDLFRQLQEITPKDAGAAEEGGLSLQDIVQQFSQKVYEECALDQGKINIEELVNKIGDIRDPYQNAFMQECEYVNAIIRVVLKSLEELSLAFKGELTMSETMETLMQSIFLNKVPDPWMKISFLSVRGLGSWLDNLKSRLDQLNIWKEDPSKMPNVTFVNRLHNPQSFLTAIKQVFAMRPGEEQELDKLTIFTHIEKKMYWEQDLAPLKDKEGAYCFGFQVEGARWDA
jgi:dynein heavy chain